MQYSTRFLKYLPIALLRFNLLSAESEKQYQEALNTVRRDLSVGRRTLRWFKQIQVILNMYKLLQRHLNSKPGSKESNTWYVAMKMANSALAVVFFSLDHVFWAYLIKLHRNRALVNRVGDISDYIYIAQSILSIGTNCIDAHYTKENHGLLSELAMESIKNFTDMITAIYFLDAKLFDDWFIGLVGCVGSAIHIYRYYILLVRK